MLTSRLQSPEEIQDFLTLKQGKEKTLALLSELTPEQITEGMLEALLTTMLGMAESMPTLPKRVQAELTDCCGTGGTGQPHFNTSTAAAFVLAAGGLPVIKFGNRAATSKSGSFDFLGALGFPVEIPLDIIPDALNQNRLAFLYAPQCYPTLASFQKLRKQLSTPTIFNYIGPLLNPFSPRYRLMGVSHWGIAEKLANTLQRMQTAGSNSLLVHGVLTENTERGLDDIQPVGTTKLIHVTHESVEPSRYHVTETRPKFETQVDYSPEANVSTFLKMITGKDETSEAYELITLNAGAAFFVAGKATSINAGKTLAKELLFNHAVAETYETTRDFYRQFV